MPAHLRIEEQYTLEFARRGESIEQQETTRMRKDGSLVHVSITISPIRDDEGRVVGASRIARDISARRAAEEAHAERRVVRLRQRRQGAGRHGVAQAGLAAQRVAGQAPQRALDAREADEHQHCQRRR